MELECALLEYATVQRGRWRDQRRPSVRSPPPHLYTQSVSARGVSAVMSVMLVASSLEH